MTGKGQIFRPSLTSSAVSGPLTWARMLNPNPIAQPGPLPVIRKLGGNIAGSRTDGRNCSSIGIVLFHQVHELLVTGQIPGAGHASRKDHHVPAVSTFLADEIQETCPVRIGLHGEPVCTGDFSSSGDRHQYGIDPSSPEDIPCGDCFSLLKAFGQKNEYSFHSFFCCLVQA